MEKEAVDFQSLFDDVLLSFRKSFFGVMQLAL